MTASPAASSAILTPDQPSESARSIPVPTAATASTTMTAPGTSNDGAGAAMRDAGTNRTVTATVSMAAAASSQKIHRQPGPPASQPPNSGPITVPMAASAKLSPSALACRAAPG